MKNSRILKEELLQGKYSQLFKEIYLDESMLEYQSKRYADAITEFEKLYGEKEVEVYSAPGRSEVCGNHTEDVYKRQPVERMGNIRNCTVYSYHE